MSDNHEGYEFPVRVWEPTDSGWRSREATLEDRQERREKAREWLARSTQRKLRELA